jgi:transcriptional regulator with XRE-family HTH domain
MRAPIDEYIIDQVFLKRIETNLTQADLASEMGWNSDALIAAAETRNPESKKIYNSKHLNKFAKIFGCSPKDFWPDHHLDEYIPVRTYLTVKNRLT